jgi:hypothetical protein
VTCTAAEARSDPPSSLGFGPGTTRTRQHLIRARHGLVPRLDELRPHSEFEDVVARSSDVRSEVP